RAGPQGRRLRRRPAGGAGPGGRGPRPLSLTATRPPRPFRAAPRSALHPPPEHLHPRGGAPAHLPVPREGRDHPPALRPPAPPPRRPPPAAPRRARPPPARARGAGRRFPRGGRAGGVPSAQNQRFLEPPAST